MERPIREEGKLHQYLNKQKQSNPKAFSRCRSLTDSRTMTKGLHSPIRNPKFSLQHRRSPSDGFGAWKVRNNDLAVEEILRERKEAIESGKLKGRRLFETAEDIGFGGWEGEVRSIFSYDSDDHEKDNIQNIENKKDLCPDYCHSGSCSPSFSSSSSYVCDDCMEKEIVAVEGGEKAVSAAAEGNEEEKGRSVINGVKGWFAIGLSVCAIGIFSVWRLISSYGDGDEVMFLVPT